MAKLVVDGGEVVGVLFDAHLDAQIIDIVDVPGRGMAHHFAVSRFGKLAAFPEGCWQSLKTQRGEELLAHLGHANRVKVLLRDQIGQIIADIARTFGGDQRIDIAPFLRPHIAQQIGADRAGAGLHCVAILVVQLGADIGVERDVERLDLLPHPFGFGSELIRAHVIARTPHRTQIGKTKLLGAFVGDADHAGVIFAHRRADIVVPARPHFLQLFGRPFEIAHLGLDIRSVDRFAVQRPLAAPVGRPQPGGDIVHFLSRAGGAGRGH